MMLDDAAAGDAGCRWCADDNDFYPYNDDDNDDENDDDDDDDDEASGR